MRNLRLERQRRRRHRGGISILEVTISLLLLGVAISGLAQLVTAASAQRRMIDARQLAISELANQAERVALWTAAETTPDKLATLAPSDELLAAVPSARLSATRLAATLLDGSLAEVETTSAAVASPVRIRIEVTWNDAAGRAVSPLGVTIWKHADQERQP